MYDRVRKNKQEMMKMKQTQNNITSPLKPKYEETLDRLAMFLAQAKTQTST
jgi:uncharacterized protein YlaN (UPF0358 family)